MPSRLLSRLPAAAVAVALLLTACSAGGSAPGTKSTPPGSSGPPMSADIPPNLTDTWLAEALLPQFWEMPANGALIAPSVERVAGKPGDQAPFYGSPDVEGANCKRWAGGLRHAARDASRLDRKARIGGASYSGTREGEQFVLVEALMVGRPALLDALAKDPLAGCRKGRVRIPMGFSTGIGSDPTVKKTDFRWFETVAEPLQGAAPLGDWSTAYRTRRKGDAWTWVKEARFGPYLLQVALVGYIPIIGKPDQADHIDLAKLDEAAATAYDHARRVLSGPSPVPTTTYPPPEPTPTPLPRLSATELRAALLTRFEDARGGSPFPKGLVTEPLRTGRLDPERRWLNTFGFSEPHGWGCDPYAKTLWYAVDDETYWLKDKKFYDRTAVALTSLRGPGRLFITESVLQSDAFILDVIDTPVDWCESFSAKVGGRRVEFGVKILWETETAWAYEITRKGVTDAPTYVAWERLDDEHVIEIRLGTAGLGEDSGVTPGRLHAIADAAAERLKRYLR